MYYIFAIDVTRVLHILGGYVIIDDAMCLLDKILLKGENLGFGDT